MLWYWHRLKLEPSKNGNSDVERYLQAQVTVNSLAYPKRQYLCVLSARFDERQTTYWQTWGNLFEFCPKVVERKLENCGESPLVVIAPASPSLRPFAPGAILMVDVAARLADCKGLEILENHLFLVQHRDLQYELAWCERSGRHLYLYSPDSVGPKVLRSRDVEVLGRVSRKTGIRIGRVWPLQLPEDPAGTRKPMSL
jgi:hypothetical protein